MTLRSQSSRLGQSGKRDTGRFLLLLAIAYNLLASSVSQEL